MPRAAIPKTWVIVTEMRAIASVMLTSAFIDRKRGRRTRCPSCIPWMVMLPTPGRIPIQFASTRKRKIVATMGKNIRVFLRSWTTESKKSKSPSTMSSMNAWNRPGIVRYFVNRRRSARAKKRSIASHAMSMVLRSSKVPKCPMVSEASVGAVIAAMRGKCTCFPLPAGEGRVRGSSGY